MNLNERPLISVVVPIYNVEKYIERCIQSILMQSYTHLELILVDDGSPDNCPIICNAYGEQDKRVKVVHKPNGGLSDARNVGITIAAGDYIVFVDGDDYIRQDMLERMLNSVLVERSDLCICNISYVDEKQHTIEEINKQSPITNGCYSRKEILKKLNEPDSQFYAVAWNKLYKKELFQTLRFEKGKIHEDEFLIHHVIWKAKRISCVKDRLYYYVQRPGSITGISYSERNLDGIEALLNRVSFFLDVGMREDASRCLVIVVDLLCNAYLMLKGQVVAVERIEKLTLEAKSLFQRTGCSGIISWKTKAKTKLFFFSKTLCIFLCQIWKRGREGCRKK